MLKFSRQEWRWLLFWCVVTLGLAALPVVWAWLATPPGQEFTGFMFNAHDGNTYLAKMQEGRRGDWVFRLSYTSETGSDGAITFVFYLLLGKLAGLLSLPNLVVFHVVRLLGGFLLLLVSYSLISRLFREERQRRFAFLLVCFAAGIGWLLAPLGIIPSPAPDLLVAEGYTFHSIFANPHFPIATALLTLALLNGLFALEKRGNRYWAWSALCSFGAGFLQPFLLVTLGLVLGVFWLYLAWKTKPDWSGLVGLIAVGLAGMPGPLLTWWGTTNDPLLKVWMSQNRTLTYGLLATLAGYGLLVPLGLAGLWWVFRRLKPNDERDETTVNRWWLVTIWLLVTCGLLLLPLNFSRRFLEGIHLPLCCLATVGWFEIIAPRLAPGLRRPLRQLVGLFSAISSFLLIFGTISYIFLTSPQDNLYELQRPPYLSAGEKGAVAWFQQNARPGEVVFSTPLIGNLLPGHTPLTAFYGHDMETLYPEQKATILGHFYDPQTGLAQRQAIIKDWHLAYLYYGWREHDLGSFDPASGGWPLVYDQGGVQIYRLN